MTEKDPIFDYHQFIRLANAAMETDYLKRLEEDGNYLYIDFSDIVRTLQNNIEEGISDNEYEYDFDEICDALQDIVFADESQILPPAVADLVNYVYPIAVEQQDTEKTNNYGTLFYTGRIGKQDFAAAEKYYAMAAKEDYPLATENLGYIYYYGRTGKVDYAKAYMCFAKGTILHRRPISTYKLGDMYKNGYYVDKEPKTSFELYKKAEEFLQDIDNDYELEVAAPDVHFRLGCCYQAGLGTEKNLDEALKYLHLAEQGFIKKIRTGDFFVKDLLKKTIQLQEKVRAELLAQLPTMEWANA